jgi:hypothetical protein
MKPTDSPSVATPPVTDQPERRSSFAREAPAGVRSLNIGRPIEPFDKKVHTNVVVTSRYHWYSFLPLNLFEQVRKQCAHNVHVCTSI